MATLQLAVGRGRYILKPQSRAFPALPENEHVTMRIASLAGIDVPPCGLFRLPDGTWAYIVVRFDRPAEGGKLRQEDFCQLAEKSPKDKYEGSAELCARLVRRYATEPLIELVKLFRLQLFSWWTGNGDMHLKNFSIIAGPDGVHRLSPAYDQVCTRLVIPDDDLALPIGDKKKGITRRTWLEFAGYCGIPEPVAERVLRGIADATGGALALVSRSFLGEEMKRAYKAILEENSRILL
jgi:serine/threonine-protein kinase HipA